MRVTSIILCGGVGSRLGSDIPKQFLMLDDKSIIEHAISKFENASSVTEIILVTIESHLELITQLVDINKFKKIVNIVVGGESRQQSTYNGLKKTNNCDFVIVHDGVRPFVEVDEIEKVIEVSIKKGNGILATKVKDTIKICKNGKVVDTPNRDELWQIQTPQCFALDELVKAHKKAIEDGYTGTDDSVLLERLGCEIYIVEGSDSNIKITTPLDLLIGKMILQEAIQK